MRSSDDMERPQNTERVIEELNTLTRGWVTYFLHASAKGHLQGLDEWIGRKLRCHRFNP